MATMLGFGLICFFGSYRFALGPFKWPVVALGALAIGAAASSQVAL